MVYAGNTLQVPGHSSWDHWHGKTVEVVHKDSRTCLSDVFFNNLSENKCGRCIKRNIRYTHCAWFAKSTHNNNNNNDGCLLDCCALYSGRKLLTFHLWNVRKLLLHYLVSEADQFHQRYCKETQAKRWSEQLPLPSNRFLPFILFGFRVRHEFPFLSVLSVTSLHVVFLLSASFITWSIRYSRSSHRPPSAVLKLDRAQFSVSVTTVEWCWGLHLPFRTGNTMPPKDDPELQKLRKELDDMMKKIKAS